MNQRERNELDRHITGNYGEDQFKRKHSKRTQVGTVIAPDGTETIVRPANGKKFVLEELQKAVGGYIELVLLRNGNGHAQMYCNEEGKLEGLAPNPKASAMALAALSGDVIVGPVIIVRTEVPSE